MKAPVVMVGYTRFRKLSASLDRLAECIGAQERDVHLFLDAPRRAEDATACEAMRRVAEWKRKTVLPRLHILQRERNYGVPGNITAAITEVIDRFGRVVFFEDDVCVSRTFLAYMDEALGLYERDARIFCVNGHHPVSALLPLSFRDDVFLAPRLHAWGVGLWKDRWHSVDFDLRDWADFKASPEKLAALDAAGCDLRETVEAQLCGRVHTWDVQCSFHMVVHGMYAVEPRLSLTKNVGFGKDAVHCKDCDAYVRAARYYDFRPRLPEAPVYREELTRSISHAFVPQTFSERLHRKCLTLFRTDLRAPNDMPVRRSAGDQPAEPVALATIDISAGGGGRGLLGDVDGDGRMELVIACADSGIDDRHTPHQVTCVTVYSLDGNLLWQRGDATVPSGTFGSDVPIQICDIDGDGCLEAVCVMGGRLQVLDGRTGATKMSCALPDPAAHDCIVMADLSGRGSPREILLKDRYERLWALDCSLRLLWTHHGNIGHFPLAFDVNGDGVDEIMAGYDLLDCRGKRIWSCSGLSGHADAIWAGDVNGDGEPEIAVGGSSVCLYSATGRELWRYDGAREAQHLVLGRFADHLPGLQVAGLDRVERKRVEFGRSEGRDELFLLDCDGREIRRERRRAGGWLTILEPIRNWNGDGRDRLLASRRNMREPPALYGGGLRKELTFPEDGSVLHGDLFGRGLEDVVVHTADRAFVYSGTPTDSQVRPTGLPVPQPRRLQSATLYPCGVR